MRCAGYVRLERLPDLLRRWTGIFRLRHFGIGRRACRAESRRYSAHKAVWDGFGEVRCVRAKTFRCGRRTDALARDAEVAAVRQRSRELAAARCRHVGHRRDDVIGWTSG